MLMLSCSFRCAHAYTHANIYMLTHLYSSTDIYVYMCVYVYGRRENVKSNVRVDLNSKFWTINQLNSFVADCKQIILTFTWFKIKFSNVDNFDLHVVYRTAIFNGQLKRHLHERFSIAFCYSISIPLPVKMHWNHRENGKTKSIIIMQSWVYCSFSAKANMISIKIIDI